MTARRDTAVVLLSGGLDSCVAAALAREGHELALLHATYGQRTAARERRAFDAIAGALDVPPERRRVVDLASVASLAPSALTDAGRALPEGPPNEGIPVTYVPFRNGLLLAAGVAWAEGLGASSVWIGAVEEDSSGYPDCRKAFLDAFARAVRLGTRAGESLRIVAPLVGLRKHEIVARGLAAGAPLDSTWSCYAEEERACGRCESCWLRLEAFRLAGVEDPIAYAPGARPAP